MEELRDHFETQHEFKEFLPFKLKSRKNPTDDSVQEKTFNRS
jgi:hypothetical protein